MPELIRYRYQPGERYTFTQEIDVLIEVPGRVPFLDHISMQCVLAGVEKHADSSVTLRLSTAITRPFSVITAAIGAVDGSFRITRRGELLGADPLPPGLPFAVFPAEPVEVKRAWKTIENIFDRPVAMSHTVGMIETYQGERVAHLVTEGMAVGEPTIEFLGVRLFGLAKGRPLLQRCIIRYMDAVKGNTHVLLEEKADS